MEKRLFQRPKLGGLQNGIFLFFRLHGKERERKQWKGNEEENMKFSGRILRTFIWKWFLFFLIYKWTELIARIYFFQTEPNLGFPGGKTWRKEKEKKRNVKGRDEKNRKNQCKERIEGRWEKRVRPKIARFNLLNKNKRKASLWFALCPGFQYSFFRIFEIPFRAFSSLSWENFQMGVSEFHSIQMGLPQNLTWVGGVGNRLSCWDYCLQNMAVKYGSSPFSCVSTSLSSPFHSKRIFQVRFGSSVWLPRKVWLFSEENCWAILLIVVLCGFQ